MAESIPKIPTPIATPFIIRMKNDGRLPAISSRTIILSNRSKRAISSTIIYNSLIKLADSQGKKLSDSRGNSVTPLFFFVIVRVVSGKFILPSSLRAICGPFTLIRITRKAEAEEMAPKGRSNVVTVRRTHALSRIAPATAMLNPVRPRGRPHGVSLRRA